MTVNDSEQPRQRTVPSTDTSTAFSYSTIIFLPEQIDATNRSSALAIHVTMNFTQFVCCWPPSELANSGICNLHITNEKLQDSARYKYKLQCIPIPKTLVLIVIGYE